VSGDGPFKPTHVAVCEVALKCCVGRHILIRLSIIQNTQRDGSE